MSTSPEQNRIAEAAAAWVARRGLGERVEHQAAFQAWLEANAAHAPAYERAQAAWRLMGEVSASPEFISLRRQALDRARERRTARRPDRRAIAAAIVGLTAAPLATFAWLRTRQPREEILQTGVGEQRTLTLSDGTRVSLDAMTTVRVNYTPAFRNLDLASGRAFFDVAKDASRPLHVHAGPRTITAIGTAFSVEREASMTSILLVEGRVAVSNHENRTTIAELEPRQELVLADGGGAERRFGVDTERALGWRSGKLFFDNIGLQAAAARMNRYAEMQIVCADPRTQALRISGVFRAGESRAFVEAVRAYFPVEAHETSDVITLRAKAETSSR